MLRTALAPLNPLREAVLARPDNLIQAINRWMGKHRQLTAMVAFALIGALGLVTVSAIAYSQIALARAQAREQQLSNLLANGRRACPDGEIVVAARDTGGGVEITVTDEGPGVPAEHREEIFEPFRRLDAARDRDRGGVGLGLYLSRQICVAHGGSIEVQDRPDGASGAHFVVTLPARSA